MRRARSLAACLICVVATIVAPGAAPTQAATIPYPVFTAVNGRVVGWARSGSSWFVVYLDRRGSDACALRGASWWVALVEMAHALQVTAHRRISGAMCGNRLAWVRAGRFSDGHHREAAFMLWTDPAIGAWTYIYRMGSGRLTLLARFAGDHVTLGRGTVKVTFENRYRSGHGEIEDVYRFTRGHYRLVSRH